MNSLSKARHLAWLLTCIYIALTIGELLAETRRGDPVYYCSQRKHCFANTMATRCCAARLDPETPATGVGMCRVWCR